MVYGRVFHSQIVDSSYKGNGRLMVHHGSELCTLSAGLYKLSHTNKSSMAVMLSVNMYSPKSAAWTPQFLGV
jgi:hypothetical protein